MSLQDKVFKLLRREFSFSSLKCFHEYPHAFAIADLYKNGNPYTEYVCFACDKSFLKYLPERKLIPSFSEKVKREGRIEYGDVEEFRELRRKVIAHAVQEKNQVVLPE